MEATTEDKAQRVRGLLSDNEVNVDPGVFLGEGALRGRVAALECIRLLSLGHFSRTELVRSFVRTNSAFDDLWIISRREICQVIVAVNLRQRAESGYLATKSSNSLILACASFSLCATR
jgi:hypothetical protein